MSNQLVKVEQLPIGELMSLAKLFAESGMFTDIKSAAQAIVKMQAGQEIGIPPFAAVSGIHIIKGKPTIGAGLIASRVKGSGKYDYKVVQQDEKACSIDFYQGKEKIGNSTFTIEDAKKAETQNIQKFPRNMLFARAISNGVKWYCPDVFSGPVYVPEEMEQVTEDIAHTEVVPEPPKKKMATDGAVAVAVARINGGEDIKAKMIETYELTEAQLAVLNAAVLPEPAGQ
jgi:hypothetical protein